MSASPRLQKNKVYQIEHLTLHERLPLHTQVTALKMNQGISMRHRRCKERLTCQSPHTTLEREPRYIDRIRYGRSTLHVFPTTLEKFRLYQISHQLRNRFQHVNDPQTLGRNMGLGISNQSLNSIESASLTYNSQLQKRARPFKAATDSGRRVQHYNHIPNQLSLNPIRRV